MFVLGLLFSIGVFALQPTAPPPYIVSSGALGAGNDLEGETPPPPSTQTRTHSLCPFLSFSPSLSLSPDDLSLLTHYCTHDALSGCSPSFSRVALLCLFCLRLSPAHSKTVLPLSCSLLAHRPHSHFHVERTPGYPCVSRILALEFYR